MKKIIVIMVALLAAMAHAEAGNTPQTPAIMLEKALYLENTVGELDSAIEIYRAILQQESVRAVYVAQARLRLGVCLLNSNRPSEALEEFLTVTQDHNNFQAVASDASQYRKKALDILGGDGAKLIVDRAVAIMAENLDDQARAGHALELLGDLDSKSALKFLSAYLDYEKDNYRQAACDIIFRKQYNQLRTLTRELKNFCDFAQKNIIKSSPFKWPAANKVPGYVMVRIFEIHHEAYNLARYSGLYCNTRIYHVDNEFKLFTGGVLTFDEKNTQGRIFDNKIRLGTFGRIKDIIPEEDYELVDIQGNIQKFTALDYDSQRWTMYWEPEEFTTAGGVKLFAYCNKKPEQLNVEDGKASIDMHNRYGGSVLESFFLVLPAGIHVVSESDELLMVEKLSSYKIYQYQKHVQATNNHSVLVRLYSGQQNEENIDSE